MTRKQHIDILVWLAADAEREGDTALTVILNCVAGAMCERSDQRLANVMAEFGLSRLAAIRARDN